MRRTLPLRRVIRRAEAKAREGVVVQRYLASAGVGSRRKCDELVQQGRVTINGRPASVGARVLPGDRVMVDGRVVNPVESRYYLLMNKPAGYTVTKADPHAKKTVLDLLEEAPFARLLNPVGRLDRDTEGLLLLTNDGELAHRLTHPSFEIARVYEATVDREPRGEQLEALRRGVRLEDGVTAPCEAELVKVGRRRAVVRVTLHEGRKRQVRRMFAAVGLPVMHLRRVALGPVTLGSLDLGKWRVLTPEELKALRRAAGLPDDAGQ